MNLPLSLPSNEKKTLSSTTVARLRGIPGKMNNTERGTSTDETRGEGREGGVMAQCIAYTLLVTYLSLYYIHTLWVYTTQTACMVTAARVRLITSDNETYIKSIYVDTEALAHRGYMFIRSKRLFTWEFPPAYEEGRPCQNIGLWYHKRNFGIGMTC